MNEHASSSHVLSLSIAGLHASAVAGEWSRGVRAAIGWAAGVGFRSIHLDAAAPEIRARDLDRSGRRDLAASIRRAGLGFTGLDLWIPPEHFEPGGHADRAHAALLGAIGLASDLRSLVSEGTAPVVVSVTLPEGYAGAGEVRAHADGRGVIVEDFGRRTAGSDEEIGVPDGERSEGERGESKDGVVRPGLDTGRVIMRGDPPGKTFARTSTSLATLRLNDADDTGRREMGQGALGVETLIALHATLTPALPIVTDLRGLDHPQRAAGLAFERIRPGLGPSIGPGLGPGWHPG